MEQKKNHEAYGQKYYGTGLETELLNRNGVKDNDWFKISHTTKSYDAYLALVRAFEKGCQLKKL